MNETQTGNGTSVTADTRSTRRLQYVAAGLAYVVAIIHLFHPTLGTPALVAYAAAGTPLIDPRPVAFVLSSVAIIVGANLILLGFPRKPIYVLGMILMLVYIGGYFGWHALGHGAWWEGLEHGWYGHSFAEILLGPSHVRNDRIALLSKLAELALFCVLALLYRRES